MGILSLLEKKKKNKQKKKTMGNYTSRFHFAIKFRIYDIKNRLIYLSRMQKRTWQNFSY